MRNDIVIRAGSIEFILAVRKTWVNNLAIAQGRHLLSAHSSPVPNPVERVGSLSDGDVLRQIDNCLAPKLIVSTGLARLVVRPLSLTLYTERKVVNLVASTVIKVLCDEKLA